MTSQWTTSTNWLISQDELDNWLDSLAQRRTLIAPRDVSGVLLYKKVKDSSEITWGNKRTVMSAKEWFFPSTDRLFTVRKRGGEVELEEDFPDEQQIIFGVHPCDARGVRLLDAVFLDNNPVDPYYQKRRENTALIGLACKELQPSCFCTSTGGAPDDGRDMDVMLYEWEGGYLVEAVTERGRFLIPGGEWRQTDQVHTPTQTSDPVYHIPEKAIWMERFNNPEYWDRMAERCHSCRVCSYVCPTCRCFVVRDEALPEPGFYERIRTWDSCSGKNYRLVAGGHRPRSVKGERVRNRIYCKFFYYSEQYGVDEVACTGCGRCVDACPVSLDITEILTEVGRA